MTANAKANINESISTATPEPSKFKVYIFDNETTPRNVVKDLLTTIFRHDDADAEYCIEEIEREGLASAGKYTYEIAEQKGIEVTLDARAQGFPLQVKVEAESN